MGTRSAWSSLALGAAALLVGASLTACAAPAASTCPDGFVEKANAAAREQGVGVTFAPASLSDMEPKELQGWLEGACVVAFSGTLSGGQADGHFAFTTKALDRPAFGLAVQELGYAGEPGTWTRTPAGGDPDTEADVISASAPGSDGTLLDLDEAFPAAKDVVASFRFTTE